jgi:hypothetical protein
LESNRPVCFACRLLLDEQMEKSGCALSVTLRKGASDDVVELILPRSQLSLQVESAQPMVPAVKLKASWTRDAVCQRSATAPHEIANLSI